MAKTSMVNRDIKRKKLVKKFASKRAELKATIAALNAAINTIMVVAPQTQGKTAARTASAATYLLQISDVVAMAPTNEMMMLEVTAP